MEIPVNEHFILAGGRYILIYVYSIFYSKNDKYNIFLNEVITILKNVNINKKALKP